MTAQERLAAAIHPSGYLRITDTDTGEDIVRWPTADIARSILAADPTLAQDIEDGAALRRLREALQAGWWLSVDGDDTGWRASAYPRSMVAMVTVGRGTTIADAADACRAALEQRS